MLQTPGVYIEETHAFPAAVKQVDLSIPIFIGYTKKAGRRGRSLLRVAVKVTSINEYHSWFGHDFKPTFSLAECTSNEVDSFLLNNKNVCLKFSPHNELYLYQAVQLYFLNGGSYCYLLSVGIYDDQPFFQLKAEDFTGRKSKGTIFNILHKEPEPGLLVLPDIIADPSIAYPIYQQLLQYCETSKRHFAILDVGQAASQSISTDLQEFRNGIGTDALQFGAAYYPWLQTLLVTATEVDYTNLDPSVSLEEILKDAMPAVKDSLKQIGPGISKTKKRNIQLALLAGSSEYSRLMDAMLKKRNRLPPAGAVAAVYHTTDNSKGIWKSPANVALTGIVATTINVSQPQQDNLLSDTSTGKYINAIRTFAGKGTMVWGARTLLGNSNEWRYIAVKRTVMMLECSIAGALKNFVFEPNTAGTWTQVKIIVENFLFNLWKQGAFPGVKATEAYNVAIGPGNSMTESDLLEGKLRLLVMVALLRPAEFIVLQFEQLQTTNA